MSETVGIEVSSGSGAALVGIRSDVYERHLEMTWMTRDDIETYESRLEDKTLFQNIALFALSGSIPLGVEKFIDYWGSGKSTDLAVLIVCLVFAAMGGAFQLGASRKKKKAETFKNSLFKEDRLVSRTFSMVETSSEGPNIRAVS